MTRNTVRSLLPIVAGADDMTTGAASQSNTALDTTNTNSAAGSNTMATVGQIGSTIGTVMGAYHGYKRDDSVGWAIGWALLGGAFWPLTIPIMLAQGFGKPAGK